MGGYTVDSSGSDCKSDALSSGGATPSPPTNIICPGCLGSLPNEEFESLTDVK